MDTEAWALWNNCQGVFSCSVFRTKTEADIALAQWHVAAEERGGPGSLDGIIVVPVKIDVEPKERWFFREAIERERATSTGQMSRDADQYWASEAEMREVFDDQKKRIEDLEVALRDCIPFVAVYSERYAREYEVKSGLHPNHAEVLDRASLLTGGDVLSTRIR